jgi:hypothetical protein
MSSIGKKNHDKADVFRDLKKYTVTNKENLTIKLSILKNKDLEKLSDIVKEKL